MFAAPVVCAMHPLFASPPASAPDLAVSHCCTAAGEGGRLGLPVARLGITLTDTCPGLARPGQARPPACSRRAAACQEGPLPRLAVALLGVLLHAARL
jgi:hypothetical protein